MNCNDKISFSFSIDVNVFTVFVRPNEFSPRHRHNYLSCPYFYHRAYLVYTDSVTSPSSLRCFSALVLALFSESKSSFSSSIWFSISRLSFSSSLLFDDSSSTLRGKNEKQNIRSAACRQNMLLHVKSFCEYSHTQTFRACLQTPSILSCA